MRQDLRLLISVLFYWFFSPFMKEKEELQRLWVRETLTNLFLLTSHPMPAPSSSTVQPDKQGSMERISGSSFCVSSWARESSIISSTVAPLECSFQYSVMFMRTVKHTGGWIKTLQGQVNNKTNGIYDITGSLSAQEIWQMEIYFNFITISLDRWFVL